jgi:nitrogen fixation NifU-like protein
MGTNELDDLYGDTVLDHCRHPRNHPTLEHPDIATRAVNPFCGDEADLQIALDRGRVTRVGAQGAGCSINQAATSMLSEAISGKTLEEIGALARTYRGMMNGGNLSQRELEGLGELAVLSGVREFPVRIKCALLAWSGLEDGISQYLARV